MSSKPPDEMTLEQYKLLSDSAIRLSQKRSKFNNKKVWDEESGKWVDSQKEYARLQELRFLQSGGQIEGLEHGHPEEIASGLTNWQGRKRKARTFKPDFKYWRINEDGSKTLVFEDVKGGNATITDAFRLRWHLLQLKYPGAEFHIV